MNADKTITEKKGEGAKVKARGNYIWKLIAQQPFAEYKTSVQTKFDALKKAAEVSNKPAQNEKEAVTPTAGDK